MPVTDKKIKTSRVKTKRKIPEKAGRKNDLEDNEMAGLDLDQFMAKMIEDDDAENQDANTTEIDGRQIGGRSDYNDTDNEPRSKSARKEPDSSSIYTKYKKPKYREKSVSAKQHKAVLESLKEKDPELFRFLENTDRDIFDFEESSDEDDVHQLPSELATEPEGGSVESSDEETQLAMESEQAEKPEQAGKKGRILVTLKMVETWGTNLHAGRGIKTLNKLVSAFQAAVAQAGGNKDAVCEYIVEGSNEFNAIVRTCLKELPYALPLMLQTKGVDMTPAKQRTRSKIINTLKTYFAEVRKLLANLAEPEVINTILKHVNQMIKFIAATISTGWLFIKTLVEIWSRGEETSRVLAFLSIIKILHLRPKMNEKALKAMYMAFIRNCKFTSPTLLPLINFMKHSLVEIFTLNPALGYQYTFVYIRQLAIHLRNSMAIKRSEGYLMVYNWQFIHSISFFSMLLCSAKDDPNISQLLFPLIEIIVGTIKCIPTAKFYPLRFHCIRMLNMIAKHTGLYVPAVSMLLEIFEITDFHKKYRRGMTKSMDVSTVLKLTKEQLSDRAFTDVVMDQFYELFLDGITVYSHTVGFPELCVPILLPMKHFIKRVKIACFTKQVKQLVQKTQASVDFIKRKRDIIQIDIRNTEAVKAFEDQVKKEGTPLTVYYKHYRTLRDRETMMEMSGKERMETVDHTPHLPTGQPKATNKERVEFKDLFADWNSDEEDEEAEADKERFKMKGQRKKSEKTKTTKSNDKEEDDAESLNSDDYDLLNQSSDDDDEDIKTEGEASDEESEDSDEDEDETIDEDVDVKEEGESDDEKKDPDDEVKEFNLKDF